MLAVQEEGKELDEAVAIFAALHDVAVIRESNAIAHPGASLR